MVWKLVMPKRGLAIPEKGGNWGTQLEMYAKPFYDLLLPAQIVALSSLTKTSKTYYKACT